MPAGLLGLSLSLRTRLRRCCFGLSLQVGQVLLQNRLNCLHRFPHHHGCVLQKLVSYRRTIKIKDRPNLGVRKVPLIDGNDHVDQFFDGKRFGYPLHQITGRLRCLANF